MVGRQAGYYGVGVPQPPLRETDIPSLVPAIFGSRLTA